MATEIKQQFEMTELEVKMEEKHDIDEDGNLQTTQLNHENNTDIKNTDNQTMKELHKHKSILDTTMSHGERVDKLMDLINWRYFLQALIAGGLALSTFVFQWIIWKYFKISQCEKDIKYLSLNNFTTAIFEGFQNGFCWIFGFIYLITATIIDDDAASESGYHYLNIRKIRFKILCSTTFIAFFLVMFISFIDPTLYYIRFPTFVIVIIILYYILLYVFKKYIRYQIAVCLLLPALVYIITIAIIFCIGLVVVWIFKDSGYGFATVYPAYIAITQTIAISVMKNYHYALCCCKGKYRVSKTYDPNSFWRVNPITERYICEEDGNLDTAHRVSVVMDLEVEDNNNNNNIIVDGRGVEYLWTDEWIFFISGLFITFVESMRISGILILRYNIGQLIVSVIFSIIMEILQRNNLIWEILYKCFLKKQNPDRCKFDAIYYGGRMQWEYVPIGVLLLMNLLNYGPTNPTEDCYRSKLENIYNILWEHWWVFVVIYIMEILSDILSELINWILRKLEWIPIDKKKDGARKIILVRMGLFGLTSFLITAIVVSENGYEMDLAISHLLEGKHTVMDDLYKRFFL
eukprot:233661_1